MNKNYVHTFIMREFNFKFFSKNNYEHILSFIKILQNKKYIIKIIEKNKPNSFISVLFKKKITLIDLKKEILELLQNYKKNNFITINFDIIQTDDTRQIASLITNFRIPELENEENKNLSDNEITEEHKSISSDDTKLVIDEKDKEIIQKYVNDFLQEFNKFLQSILEDYSIFEIEQMILSYSYQYTFKKLIIIVPLQFYNKIVINYFKENNIKLEKKENMDRNNKIINNNPLIVFNYNNLTCQFKEYMNICIYCKKYHKIFNKDSSYNNINSICSLVCSKCSYNGIKDNKNVTHTCGKNKSICNICKYYYNENYNHYYNQKNCKHRQILLESFIFENRISAIYENKYINHTKNFIFNNNDYPGLKIKNNEKKTDNVTNHLNNNVADNLNNNVADNLNNNVADNLNNVPDHLNNNVPDHLNNTDNGLNNNITDNSLNNNITDNGLNNDLNNSINDLNNDLNNSINDLNNDLNNSINNSINDLNNDLNNSVNDLNNSVNDFIDGISNNSYETSSKNSFEDKNYNTIKKINKIHNYEINAINDKEIKKGDEINIKIIINNQEYILKTIL